MPIATLGVLAGVGALSIAGTFHRLDVNRIQGVIGGGAMLAVSMVIAGFVYKRVLKSSHDAKLLGFDRSAWQLMLVLAYVAGIGVTSVMLF